MSDLILLNFFPDFLLIFNLLTPFYYFGGKKRIDYKLEAIAKSKNVIMSTYKFLVLYDFIVSL